MHENCSHVADLRKNRKRAFVQLHSLPCSVAANQFLSINASGSTGETLREIPFIPLENLTLRTVRPEATQRTNTTSRAPSLKRECGFRIRQKECSCRLVGCRNRNWLSASAECRLTSRPMHIRTHRCHVSCAKAHCCCRIEPSPSSSNRTKRRKSCCQWAKNRINSINFEPILSVSRAALVVCCVSCASANNHMPTCHSFVDRRRRQNHSVVGATWHRRAADRH